MTPTAVNHMASNNRMVNELINMEGNRDKALTTA